MKTAKLLSLSLLTLAISGCVINVKAEKADVSLTENLSLNSKDLDKFNINAGAGSLTINGIEGTNEIRVDANILTTEEKDYVLTLEESEGEATLIAKHNHSVGYWKGPSPRINLTVTMPKALMLSIKDGSGSIQVSDMNNDIDINDGSGSIDLENIVGNLKLDDGSGSVSVTNVTGNVELDDGSGSTEISLVTGDVTVDDGSGGLSVNNVSGRVVIDDGSGDIEVKNAGSLKIIDAGSGGLSFNNIKGRVDVDS